MRPAPPPRARYGYAFAAGSEVVDPTAGSADDGQRPGVVRAAIVPRPAARLPGRRIHRAWRGNAEDVHERIPVTPLRPAPPSHRSSSARADAGTDLGSNSVFPLAFPRVALVGGSP
jgi:hypothetical protein